jgi:hypothetical protein
MEMGKIGVDQERIHAMKEVPHARLNFKCNTKFLRRFYENIIAVIKQIRQSIK